MANAKSTRDTFAKMSFSKVYPMYVAKIEKKGRTVEELDQVITWLTGFEESSIRGFVDEETTFEDFFDDADMNPNAKLITGVICGHRVEDISDDLVQKVRYLDKIVDELAKGKHLGKIMRS